MGRPKLGQFHHAMPAIVAEEFQSQLQATRMPLHCRRDGPGAIHVGRIDRDVDRAGHASVSSSMSGLAGAGIGCTAGRSASASLRLNPQILPRKVKISWQKPDQEGHEQAGTEA